MKEFLNVLVALLIAALLVGTIGCAGEGITPTPSPTSTLTPLSTLSPTPSPTPTPTPEPSPVPTPEPVVWPVIGSIDIASFQASRDWVWFTGNILTLPQGELTPQASFYISDSPISNRRNGQISPTLLSGYFFLQQSNHYISSTDFDKYARTINALFIRSALMSFVDYPNNRVFMNCDRLSTQIPVDIAGVIGVCNERDIPVFIEINDSDFIPGPLGTGVDSLVSSDNITNTLTFLRTLKSESLFVTGVTFGDEVFDPAGYGTYKPTMSLEYIDRYVRYAKAIKNEFPELKIYAFDSYIFATRGLFSRWLDILQLVRQKEIAEGRILLDGFIFRESYVYMDEEGNVLDSQSILDDTESLYRDTTVYRYDVPGIKHPNPDAGYLPLIVAKTKEIFGRDIDIGITEYLPAGAYYISETDTSRYSDIDFIIHFGDMVGIYAELGLDYISKIMYGDSVDMHKAYFDRQGNLGVNYVVHEQLAQRFSGQILNLSRTVSYDDFKVKVYATRQGTDHFIVILNKDVDQDFTIRLNLAQKFDLVLKIPKRSYTSLVVNDSGIFVSGIGN